MARLFTGASNDIAANTTAAPISAVPLTMAGWARLTAAGAATRILCEIRDKDNATGQRAGWRLEMNASEQVSARTSNTGSSAAVSNSSAALTAGNWAHVGAIFAANNSRVACINGNVSAANTTSITPAAVDCVLIGAGLISTSTVNQPWDGDLAEWGIWDIALSAADILSLAAGVSPLLIRPENLVCYFPLVGNDSPETEIVNRYDLTLTGTAKSAHPRILRPSAQILQFPSAAGGSSLNISAGVDALTLAEYAATIGLSLNVAATSDALTLTEYAASVGSVLDVQATTDGLTLTEYAASIGLAKNIAAGVEALTLTEYPASLGGGLDISATTDALTLTEYPATLSFALNVSATTDALTLAEYRASITDADAPVTTITPTGAGSGRKRKKYPRRAYINGRLYTVKSEADERRLLEQWQQSVQDAAAITENLGETDFAQTLQKKAVRISTRMAKLVDPLILEDDELLALYFGAVEYPPMSQKDLLDEDDEILAFLARAA